MRSKSVPPVVWAALAVPVLWTAVLAAGVYESGMNLFQLLERLSAAAHLFSVRWTAYTEHHALSEHHVHHCAAKYLGAKGAV